MLNLGRVPTRIKRNVQFNNIGYLAEKQPCSSLFLKNVFCGIVGSL